MRQCAENPLRQNKRPAAHWKTPQGPGRSSFRRGTRGRHALAPPPSRVSTRHSDRNEMYGKHQKTTQTPWDLAELSTRQTYAKINKIDVRIFNAVQTDEWRPFANNSKTRPKSFPDLCSRWLRRLAPLYSFRLDHYSRPGKSWKHFTSRLDIPKTKPP